MTTTRPRATEWLVRQLHHLDADQVDAVLKLARAAGDADGAYPLAEHVVLHLRHGGDTPAIHLLTEGPVGLVGYAHLDVTDKVEGPSAELVVHPMHRRRGLGRALVTYLMSLTTDGDQGGRLRLWAHGEHPSANALALSLGFVRSRVLIQMRRSLYAPIPAPVLPPNVVLRPFHPGIDDEKWIELNARAFAEHPEQGRWQLRDLHVRMAEPWFDPTGFLVAQRDTDMLGFHWTKVHGEHGSHGHHHEPIGEVYILGVDPQAHGLGLGTSLTLAGLRHLRSKGLDQAMLYVDESNTMATHLYTKLGFARWATDICFTHQHITVR